MIELRIREKEWLNWELERKNDEIENLRERMMELRSREKEWWNWELERKNDRIKN